MDNSRIANVMQNFQCNNAEHEIHLVICCSIYNDYMQRRLSLMPNITELRNDKAKIIMEKKIELTLCIVKYNRPLKSILQLLQCLLDAHLHYYYAYTFCMYICAIVMLIAYC